MFFSRVGVAAIIVAHVIGGVQLGCCIIVGDSLIVFPFCQVSISPVIVGYGYIFDFINAINLLRAGFDLPVIFLFIAVLRAPVRSKSGGSKKITKITLTSIRLLFRVSPFSEKALFTWYKFFKIGALISLARNLPCRRQLLPMQIGADIRIIACFVRNIIFAKIVGPRMTVTGRQFHFLARAGIIVAIDTSDLVAGIL